MIYVYVSLQVYVHIYVYIDRGRITGKEMRSEPYSKLISGKGVFAQLETEKTTIKKTT